jgi:hypothetical protein
MENLAQKILNIRPLLLSLSFSCFCMISAAQVPELFVPDAVIVQQGGSIGYVSVGVGFNMIKEKASLDFGYGYVPESKGGKLNIISAKFAYRPIAIKIKDIVTIYPVNPGVFLSYHTGKDFDLFLDKVQYGKGYYWWSEALRTHLSFSNEIRFNGDKIMPDAKIKNVSLYSEFNTNELYFVSWFQNPKTVSLLDIFKLGYGIRVHF